MVSHHITLTIKSTAGTLPNVEFNISNNVKKILDEALKELPLDKSPQTP